MQSFMPIIVVIYLVVSVIGAVLQSLKKQRRAAPNPKGSTGSRTPQGRDAAGGTASGRNAARAASSCGNNAEDADSAKSETVTTVQAGTASRHRFGLWV